MTDNSTLVIEYRNRVESHPVSAVFVYPSSKYWRLDVFNRGGKAGSLTVMIKDGPFFLDQLLPHANRYIHK